MHRVPPSPPSLSHESGGGPDCRRLGMPRPELDIDLNAGDPSHQGWAPGLGLRTQGWMVDGSGPVKKYRWDLCIPTVAVLPSGPYKTGPRELNVTSNRTIISWRVLYVVCQVTADLAVHIRERKVRPMINRGRNKGHPTEDQLEACQELGPT